MMDCPRNRLTLTEDATLTAAYADPKTLTISHSTLEAYRGAFRAMGQRHRNVDRWRFDLGWHVTESVVANYLAEERSHFVAKAGHA